MYDLYCTIQWVCSFSLGKYIDFKLDLCGYQYATGSTTNSSFVQKSLDGFYQESGRAGRDGNDSDCVLYYRPQDAGTMIGMTVGEKDGLSKGSRVAKCP
jgi:hypothetical protein